MWTQLLIERKTEGDGPVMVRFLTQNMVVTLEVFLRYQFQVGSLGRIHQRTVPLQIVHIVVPSVQLGRCTAVGIVRHCEIIESRQSTARRRIGRMAKTESPRIFLLPLGYNLLIRRY